MNTDKCGTVAGYFRHRRAGETACVDCRRGFTAYTTSKKRKYPHACVDCGFEWASITRDAKRCRSCASRIANLAVRPGRPELPKCQECASVVANRGNKMCSDACRTVAAGRSARELWGSLRIALEAGDHRVILDEIQKRSEPTPNGCWEWRARIKDGYPILRVSKKQLQAHRLALEAKLGKPLGKQAAHHMCANSTCVNPEHLQPVTSRENVAEMLARTYLESRIADLEIALAVHEPGHPLLLEVGVAAVA